MEALPGRSPCTATQTTGTDDLNRLDRTGAPNENIVQKPLKHSIVKRILVFKW